MNSKALEDDISRDLGQLVALVSQYSTHSIAGWCHTFFFGHANDAGKKPNLTSPAKQISFLLAVTLNTPEPVEVKQFGDAEWQLSCSLLERLFSSYLHLYMPTKPGDVRNSDTWKHTREVSMLAFLHYFNNGLMASVEQISNRISNYVVPFDDAIRDHLKLSATDALRATNEVTALLQHAMDKVGEAVAHEHKERSRLIKRLGTSHPSPEDFARADSGEYRDAAAALIAKSEEIGMVSKATLRERLGPIADSYWNLFTVRRGAAPPTTSPRFQ